MLPSENQLELLVKEFLIVHACKNEGERKEGITAINIWNKVIEDN